MSETSKFTEDILGAARRKADAILTEAEAEAGKALSEAKVNSAREAESVIASAKAEAEGVRRRHVSEVRHKAKILEQQEKSKILTEVLDQARKRIMDVVKDDAKYVPYLSGLIETGIREIGLDTAIVHLSSADLKRIDKARIERDLSKKLDKPAKIEWSKEPLESEGGAMISSPDGRTRIVSTLGQRMNAMESKILVEAGKILFSE